MIPDRPLHADVTDLVTVAETGATAKIIGFFKIETVSLDRQGEVKACLDCLPDDPDLQVVGVMEEKETFYRPWELSWQGEGLDDKGLRLEARALQREAAASSYGSLPATCYPPILKAFSVITSHERMQASIWQSRTRARIEDHIRASR